MAASSPLFYLLPILLLLLAASLAAPTVARSVVPKNGDEGGDGGGSRDAAVELNGANFGSFLGASPAPFALVEFFAHWCPACRNYKPHYEKIAKLFNGQNAAHPGIILVARVDCALKVNTNLCEKFSVTYYPKLLWGPPASFALAEMNPKQEKSDIQTVDDGRTAEKLLNWINKKMGSSFGLDDQKFENENVLPWNTSDPAEIARAIYDTEEATASAFEIILGNKMIKSETRASLIKFFQLLVAHHPSRRCRRGVAEILVDFDIEWPSHLSLDSQIRNNISNKYQICGKEVPRGYWMFCRGSKKETRGFSCGLWVLLHSLTVRVADEESQYAFTTICDFIHNFFVCEECRKHFHEMCLSVSTPFNTTRGLALWLWSVHNKVNERLMKEEKALETGDPRFPKLIWPLKPLCPSCISSMSDTNIEWNEDEVFLFLVNYYGHLLVSNYKEVSPKIHGSGGSSGKDASAYASSSKGVSVGSALGIALAGCTLGAVAVGLWRTRQKSRKYSHFRSLKNI